MFTYTTSTRHILGDLHTPVSIYLRLRDLYPQSVLMESSDYHSHENARSFIALQPLASVAIAHGQSRIVLPDGTREEQPCHDCNDATRALEQTLNLFQVHGEGSAFCGFYGYTTFNAVHYFEQIPVKDETRDEHDAPDLLYILYKYILVFDHFDNKMTLIELLAEGETDHLDRLQHLCRNRIASTYPFRAEGDVHSTLTDDEHRDNIRRGIHHCLRGDVFQIVLSRRFCQRFTGDDFQLYRALRSINPSPYLFYFDFGGLRIFGSSPETHCRIEANANGYRAYIDPIAGTTRRTGEREEDLRAADYLRNDPKENAEHVMLVDLARNDLSRNCHDVHVEFYKDLQFYSHVIHLVSRVCGTLDSEASPIRTFIDTFPAGTLSGAPKVRAMQLISDIEPHNRGAYGGCIGFIGLDGSLNQAITIRTFVSRGGELWFQAGGGIVAKSDVEYELQEVNNKLGALRRAIHEAEQL